MHKRKESKLGRRIACNNCAALKKTCEYEEDTNEWDYNVSCTRCEKMASVVGQMSISVVCPVVNYYLV